MNYLKSSIQSMVGNRGDEDGSAAAGAATVERLVERLRNSTVFEDRRDALRALKSLSKRYRLDIGTYATPVLLEVLKQDSSSNEIIGYILETLNYIVSGDLEEDSEYSEAEAQDLGERFTENLIKSKENVAMFLDLIENYEFNVRLPAVRLLTGLLRHRSKDVQEILLSTPGSIPKLTDLLYEQREVIRNDAVLLLFELIRGNSNIQKTVAFQNVFDRLLDVTYQEGDSIVAEDCLYVILHLLKNNSSNQQLFRENSLIQKIVPVLSLLTKGASEEDEADSSLSHNNRPDVVWTSQRVSNVHLVCQVIRALVSPLNQTNSTASCQRVANQCGLLHELGGILMSGGVPADVLTEAINTVAELIRGCQPNQEYFDTIMAPSEPSQPAIIVLLLSMVSDKQPFALRCAVLYCIQCYLCRNDTGKRNIVETLLPTKADSQSVSAGHILCTGLVSSDPLVVWFCCCTLLHCLIDAPSEKERLLKVQLATKLGNPPVSLMQQTATVLLHSQEFLTRIGTLMFLAVWVSNCSTAVAHLLQQTSLIPYLTTQAATSEGDEHESLVQSLCAFVFGLCVHANDDSVEKFNRKALKQILERRIGFEVFQEKLESLSKSEAFARAAQKPQLKAKSLNDLVFDNEFTKLYRTFEQELPNSVKRSGAASSVNGPKTPHTAEEHQEIVAQYKEIIRRQDEELNRLKKKLGETENDGNKNEVDSLRFQLDEKCRLVDTQTREIEELRTNQSTTSSSTVNELASAQEQIAQLQQLLQNKTTEADYYRQQAQAWQNQLVSEAMSQDPNGLVAHLQYQNRELESQLTYGWQAYEQQSSQIAALNEENARLKAELDQSLRVQADLTNQMASLGAELQRRANENTIQHSNAAADVSSELEALKQTAERMTAEKNRLAVEMLDMRKEQDDLLVLLADQDVKLKEYRRRLRECGDGNVTVDDDDEDSINEEEAIKIINKQRTYNGY